MTEEEFFSRVNEALQEIATSKGRSFDSITDLDKHIRVLKTYIIIVLVLMASGNYNDKKSTSLFYNAG